MARSSSSHAYLVRKPAEAAALLDPIRLRLLRHLEFPISASGLARRLRLPRQRVNYHLRELEKRGLVRLASERRVGNCTERLLRAAAPRFRLSPEILGPLAAEPRTLPERTLEVPARFRFPESREAFWTELTAETRRLAEKHRDAETEVGEPVQVLVSLHDPPPPRRLPDPSA